MLTKSRDEEAEADAAEARRRGTELIEDHLSHHMDQNPDSSYVTWIACLHPENADVTIDERFLVPDNPWWTVYEGAKGEIPTAAATPVLEEAPPSTATDLTLLGGKDNPITTAPPEHVPNESSGLDLVVGCILCLVAILTVFIMEAAAYGIYWISAGFYRLAQAMDPPSAVMGIFYSICLLVYYILALVDSCLLIASVLTTEIVALALFILSSVLAGCDMGCRWHQYLRRTCHLLRWAFRSKSLSAYPPRHLCLVCLPKEEQAEDDSDEEEEGAVAQIGGEPTWVEPRADGTVPKENWLEAGTTVTPSAPEEPVVVLDESNVFVDHEDVSSSKKDKDAW